MALSNQPIIIRKRKKGGGHGGHHGGAWKVAYADFVTAMMAFFLVMWIVGLSQSTRKGIAGYFTEPGVFSFTEGKAVPINVEINNEGKPPTSGGTAPEQANCLSVGTAGHDKAESKRIATLQQALDAKLSELAKSDQNLRLVLGSVKLEITAEGLRIELAESNDLAFFDVGGARPNAAARTVLAALAPSLAELGNPLDIEGHTDTRPYGARASYNNWDLSADRANAVRRILNDSGVPFAQLARVSGYGDTRLRKPDAPHDISNRRVSILVRYRDTPTSATTGPAAAPGPPSLAAPADSPPAR